MTPSYYGGFLVIEHVEDLSPRRPLLHTVLNMCRITTFRTDLHRHEVLILFSYLLVKWYYDS